MGDQKTHGSSPSTSGKKRIWKRKSFVTAGKTWLIFSLLITLLSVGAFQRKKVPEEPGKVNRRLKGLRLVNGFLGYKEVKEKVIIADPMPGKDWLTVNPQAFSSIICVGLTLRIK